MRTTLGQRINDLQLGKSTVIEKIAAGGSLEARRLNSGAVVFYWRHTEDARTERVPIGTYDSTAPPRSLLPTTRGYSVAAALEAARDLAKKNRETPGGLRAARERERAAREAEASALIARAKYSLESLCDTYVGWLEKQGKSSAREARLLFKNHLSSPYPDLVKKTAAAVERREVVAVIRRLIEKGQTATGRKLRSYLRAAYACSIRADSDAMLPSAFVGFQVAFNPVEATAAIKSQADKNPLPIQDLRRYWTELEGEPGVVGAALRLHVLTGGQRPAQLARIRRNDVSPDTLKILDPKGKRSEPRAHLLPITAQIHEEITKLAEGEYLLSTDGGKTSMAPSSLTNWAAAIASRAGMRGFQLKRVRSGIETALARAGVPLHIRGQLQSHGLGGVQERHYDAHEYLPEKRQALATLYKLISPESVSADATAKSRNVVFSRSNQR